MKNLFITVILFTTVFALKAQTINDIPVKDLDVNYIEIMGQRGLFSTKVEVRIDYGQRTKLFTKNKEVYIYDENNKRVKFNSMMDALNFFSENGFEYVNSYVITHGNQNVYHHLLRKSKKQD